MSRVLVVSAAYDEQDVLPEFLAAVEALRARLAPRQKLRLLIVDDGSGDRTLALLREAAARAPEWCAYVALAANSGQQAALVAGMLHGLAWPDAIVTMDCDLEHPVDEVPRLIDAWEGSRVLVVDAIRRESEQLGWAKRKASAAFYRIAAAVTGLPLTPGQADFRLWDARSLRAVATYLPHVGSLRVFAAWMRGPRVRVLYDQAVRPGRSSRFTVRKNLALAATSIVRFSHAPLTAITALGGLGLSFALVYGAYIVWVAASGRAVPGWASLIVTVMIMGCLQLLAIGLLATYLQRLVFARALPPFVVREATPFADADGGAGPAAPGAPGAPPPARA